MLSFKPIKIPDIVNNQDVYEERVLLNIKKQRHCENPVILKYLDDPKLSIQRHTRSFWGKYEKDLYYIHQMSKYRQTFIRK